jgi:hypothetical protein
MSYRDEYGNVYEIRTSDVGVRRKLFFINGRPVDGKTMQLAFELLGVAR